MDVPWYYVDWCTIFGEMQGKGEFAPRGDFKSCGIQGAVGHRSRVLDANPSFRQWSGIKITIMWLSPYLLCLQISRLLILKVLCCFARSHWVNYVVIFWWINFLNKEGIEPGCLRELHLRLDDGVAFAVNHWAFCCLIEVDLMIVWWEFVLWGGSFSSVNAPLDADLDWCWYWY